MAWSWRRIKTISKTEIPPTEDYGNCLVVHHWRYPFQNLTTPSLPNFHCWQLEEMHIYLSKMWQTINKQLPLLHTTVLGYMLPCRRSLIWDTRICHILHIPLSPLGTTFSIILTIIWSPKIFRYKGDADIAFKDILASESHV